MILNLRVMRSMPWEIVNVGNPTLRLTLAEILITTIGMKVESFKSSLAANKDRSISAIF